MKGAGRIFQRQYEKGGEREHKLTLNLLLPHLSVNFTLLPFFVQTFQCDSIDCPLLLHKRIQSCLWECVCVWLGEYECSCKVESYPFLLNIKARQSDEDWFRSECFNEHIIFSYFWNFAASSYQLCGHLDSYQVGEQQGTKSHILKVFLKKLDSGKYKKIQAFIHKAFIHHSKAATNKGLSKYS